MAAKPSPRNHRNNPYVLDGFAAQLHTSAAGSLWRLRSEVAVLAVLGGAYFGLYRALSGSFICAAVVLAVIIAAVLIVPCLAPVHYPAGLVRDLAAPYPAGVLGNPHAHTVGPAVAGPVDPAHPGR